MDLDRFDICTRNCKTILSTARFQWYKPRPCRQYAILPATKPRKKRTNSERCSKTSLNIVQQQNYDTFTTQQCTSSQLARVCNRANTD